MWIIVKNPRVKVELCPTETSSSRAIVSAHSSLLLSASPQRTINDVVAFCSMYRKHIYESWHLIKIITKRDNVLWNCWNFKFKITLNEWSKGSCFYSNERWMVRWPLVRLMEPMWRWGRRWAAKTSSSLEWLLTKSIPWEQKGEQ